MKTKKYFTGLAGETEDAACHIYVKGFPRITVYAFIDEFGNQKESNEDLQKEANRIANILNNPVKAEISKLIAQAWQKAANHELLSFEETNALRSVMIIFNRIENKD